ncbi:phage tail protein [Facklamia sp. P12945]|uniref:phage tail protein n=2 Tax=unclassified Facklamia TaxID=2622293 RepID=UPI003D16D598
MGLLVTALGVIAPVFMVLLAVATAAQLSIFGFIKASLATIAPIALTIVAIVGFVLVIKQLWETSDQFREAVINTWVAIKEFLQPIIQSISDFVMKIWSSMTSWWNENNELIKQTINTVWGWIKTFISIILDQVFAKVSLVWD